MKNKPTLAVRFCNAAMFMMEDLQDRLEDLPLIGRRLEKRRDARNKNSLIIIRVEVDDSYHEIKLRPPESISKNDWKELILSKVSASNDLDSVSNTHLNLFFWYSENLEGTYTPDEALKFMHDNDLPEKDVLANVFGNNPRTPALKP